MYKKLLDLEIELAPLKVQLVSVVGQNFYLHCDSLFSNPGLKKPLY